MPIFEATGTGDPLGLWDEAAPAAGQPVYRVNLTESMPAARSALAENLAGFERLNAALDEVPAQLDRLVQRQQAAVSGVSFGVAGMQSETGPESELLSLLALCDATALGGTGPQGGVSFGIIEDASAVLEQAKEKFAALLAQVNHEMLHFAWVETKIAGQLIARTEVGWSGDVTTIWHNLTPAEQIALHGRTLEIVTRTRNLKLRLLITVTGGAAKMAALMAAPGGAVLAIPAMYQFVTTILEQVKQIQSVPSS